jgi:polysaccharide biosynthesis transport protein
MSRTFDLLRQTPKERSWPQEDMPAIKEKLIPPPGAHRPSNRGTMSSQDSGNWDWLQAARSIAKYWKLSALFAATVFLSVAAVTFLMKPEYEPVARLEVDPPGAEMFSLNGNASTSGDAVGEYMGTQVQKLQGDELAVDVIRKLSLDTIPDFAGKASHPVAAAAPPDSSSSLTPAENNALRTFRLGLSVKPEGGTHIIKVSFSAHDPALAATVTNTLAEMFVDRTYNERHAVIKKSSEWLSKQLDDIRAKMEQSNKDLAEYERQTGITDIDEKQNTFGLRLAELNRQYTAAQADRIQSEASLGPIHSGKDEQLPQVRDNPVIQSLTQKLGEVRASLAEAQVIYGDANPNVKKLQNQANELEVQLAAQRKRLIGAIETTYSTAKIRESLTAGELKGATGEASRWGRYSVLRKEAETNRDLYNSLYSQVKQAGITAASKSSNVRVVDQARILDRPTKPRRGLNLGLGLLAGMFGGILLAFLRQSIDKTIRTPNDVKQWIGVSGVSIIPAIAGSQNSLSSPRRGLLLAKNGSAARKRVSKIMIERPRSPEAEALRGLETSILLSRPDHPPRVILMVSSFPDEGKTTIAVNLAIMLARRGSTCLVDADLRRPTIKGVFDCDGRNLSDVLTGIADLDDAIAPVSDVANLSVLASDPFLKNPAELISSETMQTILTDLRSKFDFVVIDSPPILPFVEGRVLSTLVDGVVFVSRSGSTSQTAVAQSMDMLADVNAAPIVGFVLNGAEYHSTSYYGYAAEE